MKPVGGGNFVPAGRGTIPRQPPANRVRSCLETGCRSPDWSPVSVLGWGSREVPGLGAGRFEPAPAGKRRSGNLGKTSKGRFRAGHRRPVRIWTSRTCCAVVKGGVEASSSATCRSMASVFAARNGVTLTSADWRQSAERQKPSTGAVRRVSGWPGAGPCRSSAEGCRGAGRAAQRPGQGSGLLGEVRRSCRANRYAVHATPLDAAKCGVTIRGVLLLRLATAR